MFPLPPPSTRPILSGGLGSAGSPSLCTLECLHYRVRCNHDYTVRPLASQDARASLQDLARRFTAASLAHLRGVFTGATDAVLAVLAATTDSEC